MAFDDLLDEQKTFIIRLVELFNSGKYKSEFNGGVTFTGRYINIFGKEGENSKKIVGFSKSTLNLLHEEGYLILDSPNANSFSGCLKPKAFSEYQKWEEEIPDREKLARKFEAWLKEFKDDVCTAFERGGESKGKTSFRFWELHFINFLESKLPGYLIAYRECLLSNWSPINSDFSPLQNFMRYDGDAVQLFLEQCITDARKGHLDEFLIKGKEQEKPQIQPQVAPEAQIIESVEESRSGVITPG
ncbi:MAG: hypothetical protein LUQ20_01985, partial [Candidatus Methanoperedens sp.]|nr:hypothetical protein [Candidatus Methanoperedens sp.]